MSNLVEKLMGTTLGQSLSTAEATELVAAAKETSVLPGNYLFNAGQPGDSLHIVLDGTLEVVLGQEPATTTVATVGAGSIVGELEVMTGSLRVASLKATTGVVTLELAGDHIKTMIGDNRPGITKLMHYIAKILARRLAAVNQRIIEKIPKPAQPDHSGDAPQEIGDDDLVVEPVEVGDEDLAVLDRLWS